MEDKECWTNILDQAIEIATKVFKKLDLPAGTYTAGDVHKALTQKWGRYVQNRNTNILHNGLKGEDRYDFKYNYCHRLESDGLIMTVITPHIFYALMAYEKCAGVKPKDRHIWVKESVNTLIGSLDFHFPSKQVAQTIPSLMNGLMSKRNSDCLVLMPKQGKLLGINGGYVAYNTECKIEGGVDLPDIAFKFKAAFMNHLHGRCTVVYYVDKKSHYSLVITNEDGWMTSLDNCMSVSEMNSVVKKCNVDPLEECKPTQGKMRYECDYEPRPTETESETSPDVKKDSDHIPNCPVVTSIKDSVAPLKVRPKHQCKSRVSARWTLKQCRFLKQKGRRFKCSIKGGVQYDHHATSCIPMRE